MDRDGETTSNAYIAHRRDEALGPAAQKLADLLIGSEVGVNLRV